MKTLFLSKKIIITTLLVVITTFSLVMPKISDAQNTPQTQPPAPAQLGLDCNLGDETCHVAQGAVSSVTVNTVLGLSGWKLDIFHLFSGLGAIIAWLGGTLLDTAVGLFTVDMVGTVDQLGLKESIGLLWSIIRDIFNIFFIFGLIFAGFKIILNANDSSAKKTIGGIVVAALLINFSLYATQIVVDFSNLAAYQIYNLMDSGEVTTVMGTEIKSLSSNFTNATDIERLNTNGSQIMEHSGIKKSSDGNDTVFAAFLYGFLFLLFYTILGFVFAAGAFLLFTRFFVLIFLMIFSPVMFLGFVFPNFAKYSKDWGGKLINQALMGPAYLFMLYLSLYALRGITNIPEYGLINVIIYLLVVTAFLWASLLVAKHFGGYGASAAINIGQKWGKGIRSYATAAAGGASFGLVARGGRYFVGKRANEYAESDAAKDAAANSWWGRRRLNLARRLGDSSFDARTVGGFGKRTGLGEGIKGYATRTKEIEDREKKYGDSLGIVDDDDPQVARFKTEIDATDQAIKDSKEEIQNLRKQLADAKDEPTRQILRAQIEAGRAKAEDLEEKKKKATENYTAEKQRRQLGATPGVISKLNAADSQINSSTQKLNKLKEEINEAQMENKTALSMKLTTELKTEKQKLAQIRAEKQNIINSNGELGKTVDEMNALKQGIKADLKSYTAAETTAEKDRIAAEIAKKKETLDEKEKAANLLGGGYAATVEGAGMIRNTLTGTDKNHNKNAAKKIREEYQKKIKEADKK